MDASHIFDLLLSAVTLLMALTFIRFWIRKWESRNWPIVAGVIEKEEVNYNDRSAYRPSMYRLLFGYSYIVDGVRFAGLFILMVGSEAIATDFQHKLNATSVSVRYNPKQPETSFMVEKELLGKKVYQSPIWLPGWIGNYRSE
jgi:hypothetical protein